MRRHCKHISTANPCAIFAYLLFACCECHELLNHKASQSNSCAGLSAASDEAEFLCFAFAETTMQELRTGTKHYQNDIVRWLPESQDNCDSGGMSPMAIGAQVAPPDGYR
jgi:hypothetical protein